MKKLCKSIALLLTAFILSSSCAVFAETGNSAKKTDSSVGDYNSYLNDVARNFRSGGDAVCEINAAVGNAPVQVSANFEQDGEYIFGIIYKGASHRKKQIAVSVGVPPYVIFSDRTLIDMCLKVPFNQEEMLSVSGVGENKYERYGKVFMDEIYDFLDGMKQNLAR